MVMASETMGVTLFKALCKFNGISFSRVEAIKVVSGIERMILMKGQTGYQDYYPALYGGILCLKPHPLAPQVAQLYTPELASYLCDHLTLISSGKSRLSGINNWEVYKSFFDGDERVRQGLAQIAQLASRGYQAISDGQYSKLKELIIAEGEVRSELWPGIVIDEVVAFRDKLTQIDSGSGIKICGAGGGGCSPVFLSSTSRLNLNSSRRCRSCSYFLGFSADFDLSNWRKLAILSLTSETLLSLQLASPGQSSLQYVQ